MKLSIAGNLFAVSSSSLSSSESDPAAYATLQLAEDEVIQQDTMLIKVIPFFDPASEHNEHNEALCKRNSA